MIPIFRQRANGTCLATSSPLPAHKKRAGASPQKTVASCQSLAKSKSKQQLLPPIMRKRLVGFRHAMHIFALLHCTTTAVGRIEKLIRELVGHAFFGTSTGIGDDPTNCQ